MNVNYRAVDAIPDATPEAWETVTEHAPDLAPMILGDDDRHLATGAMRGTRDRRRAIARAERTKGATS